MEYKVVVGLPAYNESAALPKLIPHLLSLHQQLQESFRVFFVNDGSTDNTEELLQYYSGCYPFISFTSHDKNKGLGAAINTLINYCVSHYGEDDVLITMDADNTHDPCIIPALVRKLKSEGLNVVVASRFTDGGREIGLSLNRKICSRGAAWLFRSFFPIPDVHDYSSGFRAYELGYLRQALELNRGKLVTSSGFECMAEILARFSRLGVKAGEYPLVLQYQLKEGKSKMRITRTIYGYLRLLGKLGAL